MGSKGGSKRKKEQLAAARTKKKHCGFRRGICNHTSCNCRKKWFFFACVHSCRQLSNKLTQPHQIQGIWHMTVHRSSLGLQWKTHMMLSRSDWVEDTLIVCQFIFDQWNVDVSWYSRRGHSELHNTSPCVQYDRDSYSSWSSFVGTLWAGQ